MCGGQFFRLYGSWRLQHDGEAACDDTSCTYADHRLPNMRKGNIVINDTDGDGV